MPAKKDILKAFRQQQVKHFGLFVQAVREEIGLTAEALAAKAGIHPTSLWRIENGQQDPGLTIARALAEALQLSLCGLTCCCANCKINPGFAYPQ